MFRRERERHKFRDHLEDQINKPSRNSPANYEMHCVKQISNRDDRKNSYKDISRRTLKAQVVSSTTGKQVQPASKRWILIVNLLMICAAVGLHLSQSARASLIIGDSAIEIQEVDSGSTDDQQKQHPPMANQETAQQPSGNIEHPSVILDSTSGFPNARQNVPQSPSASPQNGDKLARTPTGPLPPLTVEDVTDGDQKSRGSHDYEMNDLRNHGNDNPAKGAINEVMSVKSSDLKDDEKTIAGKVVDFELTPAGGHNKAKIKKKMKKKAKKNMEKSFMQWGKKKKAEKKAMDMEEKKGMKKKKEEGKYIRLWWILMTPSA